MTKTKAQQIMAATEVRAADDVTAAIQDIAAEFEPYIIKQRIASEFGHLSNPQATEELAALITESRAAGLRTPEAVVAMHISQNNNDYDLPRAALEKGPAIAEGNARVLCGYQGRLTSVK